MVKIKHGFAAIAAFGLAVSPAMAETRSAQALPAPSAIVDSNAVSLASQPTQNADSLGGRFSILLPITILLAGGAKAPPAFCCVRLLLEGG
jgi:hypothetical protein